MFSRVTIFNGTVTFKEYRDTYKHRNDDTDYVTKYHEKVSRILGAKYVRSFGSGRGALYVLLKCLGIGPGDEVLLQGYTCVAVPKAVMYTGAKPVYADISLNDFNMTLKTVSDAFSTRIKAVIVQHTYGIPCHDIDRIIEYCKKRGVYVIEDCAHTFGGKYDGRILGTIGDAAFFSTDHSKFISTCVGGIAVTNKEELGEKLLKAYDDTKPLTKEEADAILWQLKDDAIWTNKFVNRIVTFNRFTSGFFRYVRWFFVRKRRTYFLNDYDNFFWPNYTFPGKLSNFQAYLGLKQINELEENVAHRALITDIYVNYLSNRYSQVMVGESPLIFPLLVKDPPSTVNKLKRVVDASRWFRSEILCISREDFCKVFFDQKRCPNASYAARHIINFPNHLKVTEKEAKRICKIINKVI